MPPKQFRTVAPPPPHVTGSASSVAPEPGRQTAPRCPVKSKAAALWRTHSAVAMGTCVTRYNAYHTDKNNKANNTHVLYRVIHTMLALDVWVKHYKAFKSTNIENNNIIIIIVRIWLYKVLHSPDGKKLLKASETNTTGQKSQNIKDGTAGVLLACG